MCLSFSDFEGVISEKTIAQFYLVIDINPPSTCGRLQMTSSPVLVLNSMVTSIASDVVLRLGFFSSRLRDNDLD